MDKLTVASYDAKMSLWIARIKECKSSGLMVKEWCSQNGLSDKTYYYWLRKIKKEAFETLQEPQTYSVSFPKKTLFSEIPLPVPYREMTGTAAVLYINEIRVEIQNGADAGTIQTLLSSVRELC